jgi:dUTP pyrophosphatase
MHVGNDQFSNEGSCVKAQHRFKAGLAVLLLTSTTNLVGGCGVVGEGKSGGQLEELSTGLAGARSASSTNPQPLSRLLHFWPARTSVVTMQPTVEVKILDARLRDWGLPRYQTAMAAAIDLMACIDTPMVLRPQDAAVLIPTGIAMHMNSSDLCAVILPRSGLGHKKGLVLGNSTGLIDADYTAQCYVSAWNRNPPSSGHDIVINPGERIAQMLFLPVIRPQFTVVDDFSQDSERGGGGFGSTGTA